MPERYISENKYLQQPKDELPKNLEYLKRNLSVEGLSAIIETEVSTEDVESIIESLSRVFDFSKFG